MVTCFLDHSKIILEGQLIGHTLIRCPECDNVLFLSFEAMENESLLDKIHRYKESMKVITNLRKQLDEIKIR